MGLHFSPCIFNWNTLFTGHTQRTVGFPQRRLLPRSSTNPPVTTCELLWCEVLPVQHWYAMLVNKFLLHSVEFTIRSRSGHLYFRYSFSLALRRVRKITKSDYYLRHFCSSVRPCVRMEQLGSHWSDFHKILYLSIFRKSFEKTQDSLKSVKNNGYFTWRPIYIFDHVSLNYSYNDKYFGQNLKRKSKHILCSITFLK
jgi:hypothetical protein